MGGVVFLLVVTVDDVETEGSVMSSTVVSKGKRSSFPRGRTNSSVDALVFRDFCLVCLFGLFEDCLMGTL